MVNRGAYPLNPETEVGQLRVLLGDVVAGPLDPPEAGFGDYTMFSDSELTAFLLTSSSLYWAAYYAYVQLASGAALEAKSITDQDLRVDTTKRADALLKIAQLWWQRATDDDASGGGDDFFDVFPTGATGGFIPEGMQPVYGRRYTWDRWR